MKERSIPLLSLEVCSRVITDHTFGEVKDYAGHTSYSAPGCMIYSRSYIYEPEEGRFGPEFYDTAKRIKELKGQGEPGAFSFIREEAPEDFVAELEKLGAARRGPQTGMVLEIDYFEKIEEDPAVRVISKEEIPEWEDVLFEGFGEVKTREDGLYNEFFESEGVKLFAYFDNEKIMGTSMLITEGDLSGIHEVTVLPSYRRKGAAEAMLKAMINDLKRQKIRMVSLQASPMGEPVYKKLGFKETGHIETWRF